MSIRRETECALGTITPVTTGKGIRYRLRATIDGKRESLGCFDTIDEARAQSQAYFEVLHDHSKSLTVAAWGRQWLDDREGRGTHRSIKDTRALWDRHIFPSALAPLTLRSVKQRHVQEWLRELTTQRATQGPRKDKPLAEQTVRNALIALSSAFSEAVAAGRASGNPCKGVRVPRQARTDEDWTYLTNDEIRALFDLPDLPAKQRAAFTVAIYAGMRAGEIWGLRWEDVDFDEREILVRHSFDGPTKAGKVRRIPMLPPVLEELARWRRRGDVTRAAGLVFHARDGAMHAKGYDAQWSKKWRSAAAIRPEVRFHDLRHTCASHLIMGTWGRAWRLEEVQVVLGHASRTTTERYARLAPDSIRRVANEATEQWSDDSKVAPGLVNDWSPPNSPYIQVPETTEPPIGLEPTTYGLRNRCSTN
jgi:integrase